MRLIDADELKATIECQKCMSCNSYNGVRCSACETADAIDSIDDAPTEDAEPVRHGRRGYIARYAGLLSVRRMAEFLGISCEMVREIYDDIVARGEGK